MSAAEDFSSRQVLKGKNIPAQRRCLFVKEISYTDGMALTTQRLSHGGVFLSVGGPTPNTMTIGWASIGYFWVRPVFMVVVRPSRHTYGMLLSSGEFTVSVPMGRDLKAELSFAGTISGRDVNKFSGHGLTAIAAQKVSAPIVAECGLHYECKVRLVQPMTFDQMDPSVQRSAYPKGDVHTMFFGEILTCYETE
jgi:flavin reductase (DIM6/NTAB) family NADH-FMN oxidoreductase RutF